ncbi:Hypothetical protein R9X50_00166100 [Acrodontium crateriforme]|uniref:Uncharacterized protein n=1 Tax=Acrodontium crateriforme TaxID=150365 RepID=A0AAQ3LZF2_9PEZI|nr:Hypothetical protein R9X50_00166100 [Acrodontium crateriforme]
MQGRPRDSLPLLPATCFLLFFLKQHHASTISFTGKYRIYTDIPLGYLETQNSLIHFDVTLRPRLAMPRRTKATDLTESWDDMDHDEDGLDDRIYDERDERSELGVSYRTDRRDAEQSFDEDEVEETQRPNRSGRRTAEARHERQRNVRIQHEAEQFVMPASPDAVRPSPKKSNLRASTPHFRLNERSMTSDAGQLRAEKKGVRGSTPRSRLNERSLTSDAGSFQRGKESHRRHVNEYDDDDVTTGFATRLLLPAVHSLIGYLVDIVGLAFRNAKPLLGWLLLGYLLFGVFVFGAGFLTNTVHRAMTPICRIPGASWLNLSFCPSPGAVNAIQGPAEFDKLVQVQSAFDDVLATTAIGANLPLDMKRSEASIRDLKHVVEYSSLPSRNELVFEFGGFIETARQASQDLSKFNSRIGRAVDQILSTNRWTLSIIDGVSASTSNQGALTTWLSQNFNLFAPFQPVSLSRDILLEQYLRHTSAVEDQINALITEAQALLSILDNLDARLDVIASIALRDDSRVQDNREELFAYLWTKLGGNRNSVAKLDSQLNLLKEVGNYRRLAWAHVTTTIVKLQSIRDNLEDLRERVAMPEVVGTDQVPLEVHIGAINLGIERLEAQRDESRRVEKENYARILARGEQQEKARLLEAGKKEL